MVSVRPAVLSLLVLAVLATAVRGRDEAAEQLAQWAEAHPGPPDNLTTDFGAPIADKLNVLTAGPRGPMLLQDTVFIEEMAHFDRERIPERVVHAKGAGAFGYFEVTKDITRFTRAKLFSEIGKKTSIAVRFSTVSGESGSADTGRENRGYAIKFYTEDGIWDIVGNNSPIFFIRDPMQFPSMIHTQKRNPVTHLKDPDMYWDFFGLRPEMTYQIMLVFSDTGLPDGYRHMHGFGSHTFKLVNAANDAWYCKFHYLTDQGIKNLAVDEASKLSASDPDYAIRDLYNAIANGQFPSWTFYIQVMTFEQASTWRFNPFDLTKIWPEDEFPLIEVGKVVLNRNPSNYFTDVEQIAMSPANLVPGIEASPDRMLQGRLFSYPDTQRYRLGSNVLQIPVNCPYNTRVRNYQRDGLTDFDNQDGAPSYFPNSFHGPQQVPSVRSPPMHVTGDVDRWNTTEDDFTQPGIYYRGLQKGEQDRLVQNLVGSLSKAQPFIQERATNNFAQADPDFGKRIQQALAAMKSPG